VGAHTRLGNGKAGTAPWMRVRTLIATSTACVLLAIPTTTEPCFTASAAYSTWNIRPCGELGLRLAGVGNSDSGLAEGRLRWRDPRWSLQCDRVVVVVVSEHDGGGFGSRSKVAAYPVTDVDIDRENARRWQCRELAGCLGAVVVWFGASFRQPRAASPSQATRYLEPGTAKTRVNA
jgi:hypothetical protein